jgi:hypothetical protein
MDLTLQDILEGLLKRVVRVVAHEDCEAATKVVQRGFSRKLAYLRKHTRTSISALHETYISEDAEDPNANTSNNMILQTPSVDQVADIFTKPVDHATFWRLCEKAGVISATPKFRKK